MTLTWQLTQGRDANGDGRVTSATAEGGLLRLQTSVGILLGARTAPPPPVAEVAR